ncbi:MAG TPA: dTDP-4-dehydrorhamnose 3,5-epimerase [Thermoleophilaceae bacterium]|nr:dTDP-4-dehydrorhamnose 3,5-epimerase [Thermoleophilaceae bacterium]
MLFTETPLAGAFLIEPELLADERGFFARTFCANEFSEHGLQPVVAQANLSFNHKKGTLRGMHYQVAPAEEAKLVRCTSGAIFDVIIDLRPDSPTYLSHFGAELSADNHAALYVPEMFAHGYQALADGTEVIYQVSEFYTPGAEQGLRHDDPAFGIEWPLPVSVISEKDRSWPPFRAASPTRQ